MNPNHDYDHARARAQGTGTGYVMHVIKHQLPIDLFSTQAGHMVRSWKQKRQHQDDPALHQTHNELAVRVSVYACVNGCFVVDDEPRVEWVLPPYWHC